MDVLATAALALSTEYRRAIHLHFSDRPENLFCDDLFPAPGSSKANGPAGAISFCACVGHNAAVLKRGISCIDAYWYRWTEAKRRRKGSKKRSSSPKRSKASF